MSVHPIRDFIVVSKVEEEQQKTKGGLFVPGNVEEKTVSGRVLAVGSGRIALDGTVVALEVQTGDLIKFNKNMCTEVSHKGETVWVLREDQVICILK